MLVNPYEERNRILLELGINSYTEYLARDEWAFIREEVVRYRDHYKCRSITCKSKSSKKKRVAVHHLAYSRAVLLGINPSCLVTLCKDCHRWCEFDESGKKLDFKEVLQRSFELVIGERKVVGRSSSKIGNWFRNAYQMNRPFAIRLLLSYESLRLPWYCRIIEELRNGKLPGNFAKYLYLTKENLLNSDSKYSPPRATYPKRYAQKERLDLTGSETFKKKFGL